MDSFDHRVLVIYQLILSHKSSYRLQPLTEPYFKCELSEFLGLFTDDDVSLPLYQ